MRRTLLGLTAALLGCPAALAQQPGKPAADPAPIPAPKLAAAPPPAPLPPPGRAHAALCDMTTACCQPPCGPDGRVWVGGELLLWFVSGSPLPPLVTTGPATAPRAVVGALGQPGTVVLSGGDRADYGLFPGFRLRGGFWFDEARTWGVEGSFIYLGRGLDSQTFQSGGNPPLLRPFLNTVTGLPDTELVALPGVLAGSVTVDPRLIDLIGGDVNLRCNLSCSCDGRLDALVGFRVLGLTEDLTVTERLLPLAPTRGVPAGTAITVQDRFRTDNTFYGGQIGVAGERRFGRWFVDGRALIALGVTERAVEVSGATTFVPPGGAPTIQPGGLLALPSNIGRRDADDTFAVMPEVAVNVGYQVTDGLRVSVGYTFLYASGFARPGDQIDLGVDPRQLPPATAAGTRPAPVLRDSGFWAQGVNFGMQLRY